MDQFLYHLAEMKYRMWHELYVFAPRIADEEYLEIIKAQSKYIFLLEIIDLLPEEQAITFREIEQEFFSDSPYVYCKKQVFTQKKMLR
ncbi:hypothetical protein [Bacillus smithii]|uniref:hypothetical protein n=1 Tax=Bacillus smithii TaxID=1479 RepID=UPI003D1DB368